MRTLLASCWLVAALLMAPQAARAEDQDSFDELRFIHGILKQLDNSFPIFDRDVTISVKGLKKGRLQGVTLERRDASGRLVASLRAKEVELWRLDWKTMRLLVLFRDANFTLEDGDGWLEERVTFIPLSPEG